MAETADLDGSTQQQGINRRRVFIGSIIALVATSFGFAVRGFLLQDWGAQFGLTEEQRGIIQGVGLYPFALSIILVSLIIDRIGYGVSMVFAFALHVGSVILTLCAPLALAPEGASPEAVEAGQQTGYIMIYLGTFLFALGNGTVEAVINPVTATMYQDEKTHYLNILHAGWPGGLVLGGLLSIAWLASFGGFESETVLKVGAMFGWQWKMVFVMLPMILYGIILFGQQFPVQERVAAGVSYRDMLEEFGWGSCFIVSFLVIAGINQVLGVFKIPTADPEIWLLIAILPTVVFAFFIPKFGRPMFVLLLLVMFLLATTELGTDSWIQDIMSSALESDYAGPLVFVYAAGIMTVLRFFGGPLSKLFTPLGLLAICCVLTAIGLVWLSVVQTAIMVFLAATIFGVGKSYFWPTTLGVVSEQFPKGGALTINAIAGVGMIAVGTLGGPAIGTIQDIDKRQAVESQFSEKVNQVTATKEGIFMEYQYIDQEKLDNLNEETQKKIRETMDKAKQGALQWIAILPVIMLFCYLGMIGYFVSQGGYEAQTLEDESEENSDQENETPGEVAGDDPMDDLEQDAGSDESGSSPSDRS